MAFQERPDFVPDFGQKPGDATMIGLIGKRLPRRATAMERVLRSWWPAGRALRP